MIHSVRIPNKRQTCQYTVVKLIWKYLSNWTRNTFISHILQFPCVDSHACVSAFWCIDISIMENLCLPISFIQFCSISRNSWKIFHMVHLSNECNVFAFYFVFSLKFILELTITRMKSDRNFQNLNVLLLNNIQIIWFST